MAWSALAAALWGGLYVVSQLAFGNHLAPATLSSLTTAQDTERTVARQSPPTSKASPGELSPRYLNRVSSLGARLADTAVTARARAPRVC